MQRGSSTCGDWNGRAGAVILEWTFRRRCQTHHGRHRVACAAQSYFRRAARASRRIPPFAAQTISTSSRSNRRSLPASGWLASSTTPSSETPAIPHVHVQRERRVAKFWLDPITLQRPGGFSAKELNAIAGVVATHHDAFLEEWNAFFLQ